VLLALTSCASIVGIGDVPGGDSSTGPGLHVDGGSSHHDSGFVIPGRDSSQPGFDTSRPGIDSSQPGFDVTQPGQDTGVASGDGGLGYAASNIGAKTFDPTVTGPLTLRGDNCRVYTEYPDPEGITCDSGQNPPQDVFAVDLPDGAGKAVIYVFTYVFIDNMSALQVTGPYPLIIVALGSVDIAGSIDASADVFDQYTPVIPGERLTGPGVGAFNNGGPQGGGGGSFCGIGGTGAMGQGAAAGKSAPGMAYGSATLVPLWGGSPGGGANIGGADQVNGNGGGAIQISAMMNITLEATGYISVNGSGGVSGGDQSGAGGGSGGAILLEAPTVTVKGILEANGGEGSDNNMDGEAPPSDGGVAKEPGDEGGRGSGGSQINGGPGQMATGAGGGEVGYGAGGGGAGRIRINATHATLEGDITPSLGSACATQGPLP
jgi:hypothetical protein